MTESSTFIDAVPASAVDVADRGLAYGHGLFETMRMAAGRIPLWPYHRERLLRGLPLLGIELAEPRLQAELAGVLKQVPADGVLKLMVTAGSGGRGYRAPTTIVPRILLQWSPAPPCRDQVRLQVCRHRLPIQAALAGLKHLNRLDQVIAAGELVGDNLGLMLDADGNLVEGVSHNLFMYIDGGWLTPSLDRCGVAGVMRAVLMREIFPQVQERVSESRCVLADLQRCEALFLCNAVAGIVHASAVEGGPEWNLSGKTRRIQAALEEKYPCFTA
ncbi:MAG: aminodeoxychorismate lyase [Porticoccaceae bacterium]